MLTRKQILDELNEKKRIEKYKVKTRHSSNEKLIEYAYDEERYLQEVNFNTRGLQPREKAV